MHYKSMQSQAREKHQQLRHEAELHRLVRQSRSQRHASRGSALFSRAAGALSAGIRYLVTSLDQAGHLARRLARGAASAVHL